jgi:hypothetical protein
MNTPTPEYGDGNDGDVLDWLHSRGKQRAMRAPEFDVEETLDRVRAARDGDEYARNRRGRSSGRRREDTAALTFWSALSAAEQQTLMSVAHERTFADGDTLMHEGEEADHVIVIRSGWIKVCVNDSGTERIVAERGPGQLVGERGAFQANVRSATIVALETVKALVVPTEDFAAFVSEHPGVLRIIEGQLYDRLTEKPIGSGHGRGHARGDDPADVRTRADWPATAPRAEHDPGRPPQVLSGEICTVVLIGVPSLGAHHLRDEDRRVIKTAVIEMTQAALARVWDQCRWEDRGDGLLIVVPPSIATATVVKDLHEALPIALKRHNRIYGASLPIQLRLALTVGPVASDAADTSGEAVAAAARLVEAPDLKRAVADSHADIGVIVSSFVYENFIANAQGPVDPFAYHQVRIAVKESSVPAWMQLID